MYSVVALTMWKCNRFQQTLRELSKHPLVGEIILIDNTSNDLKIELPKLIHILEGKNTYINPAWNKGVSLAKYDKLLVLNDDLWFDWNILSTLESYVNEEVGMIGMAEENFDNPSNEFGLEPINHRNGGFACAFFIHKNNWIDIPFEMKLWGGDDWLFVKKAAVSLDGDVYTLDFDKWDRDNSGGKIYEWSVLPKPSYNIIVKIIKSKNAKIRYTGDKYHDDRTITSSQKAALKSVLQAYYGLYLKDKI